MQNEKDVLVSEVLSLSHRKASIIRLSFDFPFFGHIVRNVTVATGGFLYTGDYIHAWLAATQYIAPLMANFDTKSHNSQVRYRDNGTAFTVEWYHVTLEDHTDAGHFTFQVTLHSSGDIVFVYKELPILVEDIEDFNHPVKVGLADAYIIDRTVFLIKRKTIYEYHKVQFKGQDIRNWTVVYMKALPTCLDLKDCHSCLTEDIKFPVSFFFFKVGLPAVLLQCKWCPHARRCSTGFDRKRQDWNEKMCDTLAISEPGQCNCARGSGAGCAPASANELTQDKTGAGEYEHVGMLAIVFAFVAVFALAMWVLYAYRNPHTPSGQVLIRYRPSHWSLRRGEARYTAATIHM
ncbi:hypothetical protein AAG570_004984 [Ranatra chinensis]|uniref:Uncharacterized protein n=1 Tax=Ranatra chinensis TaxID=642074 RepID=A0ABD0XZ46_9HEMI